MILTMTAWRRPQYTRRVLESIIEAEKPGPIRLIACIEPGNEGVPAQFRNIPFDYELRINDHRLGGPRNTYQALSAGFELDDHVIHLEDDTVIASDALLYFDWAIRHYRYDKDVWTVTGYNRRVHPAAPHERHTVKRRRFFTAYGIGLWIDRWEEAHTKWPSGEHGWDRYMNRVARGNRSEIFPLLSRIQNIGALDGYNVSPSFHKRHHHTPEWAGNYPDLRVTQHQEVS
jgi:hypothetical protein